MTHQIQSLIYIFSIFISYIIYFLQLFYFKTFIKFKKTEHLVQNVFLYLKKCVVKFNLIIHSVFFLSISTLKSYTKKSLQYLKLNLFN